MPYFTEDDMQLCIQANVVPCRGREGQPDTFAQATFTAKELDAIAPLEPFDSREMGDRCVPSSETIERVQERILAARRLKYGG